MLVVMLARLDQIASNQNLDHAKSLHNLGETEKSNHELTSSSYC